jgi:hypothetical protein
MVVVDDATNKVLHGRLWPEETTEAVMTALTDVIERWGIPMALYTDRASWAAHTPRGGGKVDKERLTQVGRALKRLGIEHIVAYSPQARGRSERMNGTIQGRLVNELRVEGIGDIDAANVYIAQRFIPQLNQEFARAAKDQASAFVSLGATALEQILCHEEDRVVGLDNTVQIGGLRLQIAKQPGRASCARWTVSVRRHLDHTYSIWRGLQCLGRFEVDGCPTPRPTRLPRQRKNSTRPTGSFRSSSVPDHSNSKRSVHLSK